MQVFRSEIKVGILVTVSFALFVIGIFVVSDIRSLWDKKKTLVLLFPYSDGITRGSPVWWAGYEVGGVKDIRIAEGAADRIALTIRISPEAKVRQDSHAEIRSLGMMGAKYVELSPGSPDSPELPSGAVLEGKSASSLSEIMATGQQVASGMVELVNETKQLIKEVRTEYSLKETASSARETIQNANGFLVDLRKQTNELAPILKNLRQVTGDGGAELIALFKDVRETNKNLQKSFQSIEKEMTKALGHAGRGFAEAEGTVKGVRTILSASEDDITSLLLHLNETTRNLKALSEDLKSHPWKIVWKADGAPELVPAGAEQWREKGRIGPYGKK
ncbi:MAG: MlaD family protein [Syntrophobacteraceae bacterium]